MKKILVTLLLLCSSACTVRLFAQGIEFVHGNWADVKQKAKQENKLIFIDFYTVWCGPCKMMSNEVFPLPEVGSFFNRHFISWKVDAEKGEGKQLAAKYGVKAYPTLLFVNSNEEETYKVIGSANGASLIEHGKTALNPSSDFSMLKEKYRKNELKKEEFGRYLTMIQATGNQEETSEVFTAYFRRWPEISKEMFSRITEYVNAVSDPAFQYMADHQQEFASLVGKEKTGKFLRNIYLDEVRNGSFKDEAAFRQAKAALKKKISIDEKDELELDLFYAIKLKDIGKYLDTGTELYEKYFRDDAREIGNLLGTALRITPEDQGLPPRIKQWAQRAFELKENSINDFQLGMVCLREGSREEAGRYFEMALSASRRDNDGLYDRMDQMRKELMAPKDASGVRFRDGTWEEIKTIAKKENKLIFIDFYTVWCAPCKAMLKEVFTDKTLGDYYNKHFVSIKVDAEKGEGIMLAQKYGVGGFPTFLFVNTNEDVVYSVTRAATIAEMMEEASIALTPGEDFNRLKEQYAAGTLKKDDLYRYLNLVKMKKDPVATAKVFETWFNQYPEISPAMFRMIVNYVNDPAHPAFQYLLKNKESFSSLNGKEPVDEYIRESYLKEFRYRKKFSTDTAYTTAKLQLMKQIAVDQKLSLELDKDHFYFMKNEKRYMKAATQLYDRYYKNDHQAISLMLGGATELVKDPKSLKTLRKWAEQALFLKDNSLNNLTLAMILLKEKNKREAEKYLAASKAASTRDNDGYLSHILMLEKRMLEKQQ